MKQISDILTRFPTISALFWGYGLKFCFCKESIPIFLFVFFGLLYLLRKTPSAKSSFALGYAFGIGYFGSTLYWVAESFKCVGMGNLGYIAVAFLVLYLAIYPALSCYITTKLATNRINFILFFAVFWTLSEYIRGFMFTGFPWNLIGYATYDIPYFSQMADLIGAYGVSFISLLIIGLCSYRRTIIHGLAISAITLIYGIYKTHFYDGYAIPKTTTEVTIVQPSISQEDKLNPSKFKDNLDKHIALSNLNSNVYKGSRLIIWPEAAINTNLESNGKIIRYVSSQIEQDNTYIVTGNDRVYKEKLYNSLSVFGKDSEIIQIYDKRHLLPFGEFIPETLLNLGFRKVTQGMINFSSGTLPRTIKIDNIPDFDCIICYESAFPGEIMDNSNSSWILNITNDSWFKNSGGPSQHLKTACFRAIEEGRMIIRCANNGISAIIDCNGGIIKKLKTDEIGVINFDVPGKYQKTVFSVYKNAPILIILFLMLAILIYKRKPPQAL